MRIVVGYLGGAGLPALAKVVVYLAHFVHLAQAHALGKLILNLVQQIADGLQQIISIIVSNATQETRSHPWAKVGSMHNNPTPHRSPPRNRCRPAATLSRELKRWTRMTDCQHASTWDSVRAEIVAEFHRAP